MKEDILLCCPAIINKVWFDAGWKVVRSGNKRRDEMK
jgi:hypothetical protein